MASLAPRLVLVCLLSELGIAACARPVPTSSPATSGAPASIAIETPEVSLVPSTQPSQPSQTPVASATGYDACALLPMLLLSDVFGGKPAFPKAMPSGGWIAGQCAWSSESAGFFVKVATAASLKSFGDPAAPDAKAKLAAFRDSMSATGAPRDVAGLGDGAVIATSGIAAYKGDTYLEITNLGLTDEQLIQIAKLAVANF